MDNKVVKSRRRAQSRAITPSRFGSFCLAGIQSAQLALCHQLAVYRRTAPRPNLRTTDHLFWVGLARVWTGWRQSLVIVTPATVLRWQRRRFREHSIAPSSQTSVMGS